MREPNYTGVLQANKNLQHAPFHVPANLIYMGALSRELSTQTDKKQIYSLHVIPEDYVVKKENEPFKTLPHCNSFKYRGAFNMMYENRNSSGTFLGASAGNHAQGLAMGGQHFERNVIIFMPENTPQIKVDATKKLGGDYADIRFAGDRFIDAYAASQELLANNPGDYLMVPPYDHHLIIEGQGTIALDLIEQIAGVKRIDPATNQQDPNFLQALYAAVGEKGKDLTVNIPSGGGGLTAGMSLVLDHFLPQAKIVAVEPEYAASATAAKKAGRPVPVENTVPGSIDGQKTASGIAVTQIGNLTDEMTRKLGVDTDTVNHQQIRYATAKYFKETALTSDESVRIKDSVRQGNLVEQSGAIGYGKVLKDAAEGKTSRKITVNVVTGANLAKSVADDIRNGVIDTSGSMPKSSQAR